MQNNWKLKSGEQQLLFIYRHTIKQQKNNNNDGYNNNKINKQVLPDFNLFHLKDQ